MNAEQKIGKLIEEAANQKTICLIKGNPKYWIKGTSEKFYDDIKSVVEGEGFKLIEAESAPRTPVPEADAYIMFSRGCGRERWIAQGKPKAFLGCGKGTQGHHNISLFSPDDNTMQNDMAKDSLLAHWTLTKENKEKLKNWVKKIK